MSMRDLWRQTLGCERGSALLLGLYLIMIMSLLGVTFLELTTIEASLVTKDTWELQAFYCAEAQAARLFNLYSLNSPSNPIGDASGTLGSQTFSKVTLTLANGSYAFSGSVAVDAATQVVTVKATCALPNGPTRTVQRGGVRQYLNTGYQYAVVGGGYNPATGAQELLGTLFLGGNGVPYNAGNGNYALGSDTITGRVYAAGNVYLTGESTVNSYGAGDPGPRITVYPGQSMVDNSTEFDSTAVGATGQSKLDPMPILTNPQATGVLDQIKAAVNPGGSPVMKGTYGGTTVYNLSEIFAQLGATREGNKERNLARPDKCTFGVASPDPKCQIWQDLVIIGPRQACAPACDSAGPTDTPSYYFMGMPRSPSEAPQQTGFSTIFDAAVNASAELRQLGFVAGNYATLGQRLDALLGTDIDGEGRAKRLIELTVGVDPDTGQSVVRPAPPIFYVDGYWRADGGTSFGYNGRATIAASKSVILSDNLLYLGSLTNVNTQLPDAGACPNGTTDRTNCGLADMLGLMAKDDIWMGDSNGTVHEISAVMLAGRDFNFFDYTSSGGCCKGPSNPTTFNGTVMATRQAALIRDWAALDPPNGQGANGQCNSAGPGCQPVAFFPSDSSCGILGCWKFMKLDVSTGILVVDPALPSFKDGCVTTSVSPLTPAACPPGSRRVTHFQLKVNYDTRLMTNGNLLPIGLPPGGNNTYLGFDPKTVTWKDCGSKPSCPQSFP
jgi:hypothetical protein